MANTGKLFADIATRTNGEIHIGVVGPVRTGKSTFITKFMQSTIVPKISNSDERARVVDELPQSGDGTTIMTTQPKFVPNRAVEVQMGSAEMRVRMIDCVGYIVHGAGGHIIDGKPRLVKTPWSDNEMPFEKAAEMGTRKVIKEHSTIAVVMTTDGSVAGIARENYVEAEERVISQLKKMGKPFVVIVNSRNPHGEEAKVLSAQITKKHSVATLALNVNELSTTDINQVFTSLLAEFGVNGFKVNMPKWLTVLDTSNEIIHEAIDALKKYTASIKRLSDNKPERVFEKSAHFARLETTHVDVATGIVTYNIVPHADLYTRVLSSMSGANIASEAHLVAYLSHSGKVMAEHNKIREALAQATETGYGIMAPTFADYVLHAPQLHKSGRSFGLKLRATAPSLHLVRVDVATDVLPTIGTREQSEEMLKLMSAEFETNKDALWQVPIFGKSLESIVREGITGKANAMSMTAKVKMKRTLTKIVNNGRGRLIAIPI